MDEGRKRQQDVQKNLIDLHLHTTNSDGEESPETVIQKAKETGHSWIAITDHNRFTFTEPQKRDGITVLPGNEFSVSYYVPSWKRMTEIHIVGIFPNGVKEKDFEAIRSEIGKGKEAYVAAMEVYYEMYLDDPEKMAFLHRMREKYDLLASAASDRHRKDQDFTTVGGEKLLEVMREALEEEQV